MARYRAKNISIKNKLRNIPPLLIGPDYNTALKVTVGITKGYSDISTEIKKIIDNIKLGMNIASDVTISSLEDINSFHRYLVNHINIPIASVPTYEVYLQLQKDKERIISKDYLLDIIERQAKRGIDIMSIHGGFSIKHLTFMKRCKKYVALTARTGGILYAYMKNTGRENPLYESFDEILNIAKKYNITLSMAHVFRPGCIADEPDYLVNNEMKRSSILVKRALAKGVNIIVEVGGHIQLILLKEFMANARKIFNGAILSMMGPILTDLSIGHDHITAAIGFTHAGLEGADMVVNITPDEHIGIPSPESVKEGIIAHKIACHIIDTYKMNNISKDLLMAQLRKSSKACFVLNKGRDILIDPHNDRLNKIVGECSMCGSLCPYKTIRS